MKEFRTPRLIASGLLFLAGVVIFLHPFLTGSHESTISAALICIIGGICLTGSGRRTFRNVMAGCLLLLVCVVDFSNQEAEGAFTVAVLLAFVAVLFSGSLSKCAAKPLTGIIDSIYFGNESLEAPPLTLRLARAYRSDLRFEEAMLECERQLEYHPRSLELWLEMIHAARESGNAKAVRKYMRRARQQLGAEDCRQMDFEFQR
jgi:hypothetical protein